MPSHSEGVKWAVHLVAAWCSELQLCLGQYKTEDKITAIPVLPDLLQIEGCLVTIDAMGCPKDIAGKADYLLGLKGNQETVHEEVKRLFEEHRQILEDSCHIEYEPDNGRVESRKCRILLAELLPPAIRSQWPGLSTLVAVCTHRGIVNQEEDWSSETPYYLASGIDTAAFYNCVVRNHRVIENQLHWRMDVCWGEDLS